MQQWRDTYNNNRPHEALEMKVPVAVYTPSPRTFPSQLPEIVYPGSDIVRLVSGNSGINVGGVRYAIGRAFRGQPVALRPTPNDGLLDVYYCHQRVGRIGQKNPGPMQRVVTDLPPAAGSADTEKVS